MTESDNSVRVETDVPHLVSLGGGRLSVGVTILAINPGRFVNPGVLINTGINPGRFVNPVVLINTGINPGMFVNPGVLIDTGINLGTLMVRWVVGSILPRVDPLSYFSFQPVLHDRCNKGSGMCYPVCGMVHI